MASGKFRSESHLIDQKAVFFVRENHYIGRTTISAS